MSWVHCPCGRRHWGRHGAAGLLLNSPEGDVLLTLRSPRVDYPGVWSTPGGALGPNESAVDAALREAAEETGLDTSKVTVVGEIETACPTGWAYHVVIGVIAEPPRIKTGWETADWKWVPYELVPDCELHPGLAAAWPKVLRHLPAFRPGVDDAEPLSVWRFSALDRDGQVISALIGSGQQQRVTTTPIYRGRCDVDPSHLPPDPRCECGVYGATSLEDIRWLVHAASNDLGSGRHRGVTTVLYRGELFGAVRHVPGRADASFPFRVAVSHMRIKQGAVGVATSEGSRTTHRGSKLLITEAHIPGSPRPTEVQRRGVARIATTEVVTYPSGTAIDILEHLIAKEAAA